MLLPSFLISKGSKTQIDSKESFIQLFSPTANSSFTEQLENADKKILKIAPSIAQGALSNVHGSWYEWILAHRFWNYFLANEDSYIIAKLPNVTSFDVADLFDDKLRHYILDLRQKVALASGVELVTSNPDFLIFNPRGTPLEKLRRRKRLSAFNFDCIEFLDTLYKSFVGQCNFDSIVGFIASKTSFRPDRRLQIPHEGSLMKAIYAHLVTREWVLKPRGLQYYAIACNVGDPDRKALKTVATHSITTVSDLPKAAVDEVFRVNSNQELDAFLQFICGKGR